MPTFVLKMAGEKFSLLRTILRTIGLSDESIEDIIDRIVALLSPKTDGIKQEYPYALRDDFLSPAEQSFCQVLRSILPTDCVICPKVALADLFFAKTGDPRQNRIFLNRIDRKHVDFLLCDLKTLRPIVGIELDDKSHDRPSRLERDEFVDGVFQAAKLPLVRIPARRGYVAADLNETLGRYLSGPSAPFEHQPHVPATQADAPSLDASISSNNDSTASGAPLCPKCGSEMVLRTAKTGTNQGNKFWGCRNFPRCRSVIAY